MRKSILSASIAAMIGGLGLAGVASASVFTPVTTATTSNTIAGTAPAPATALTVDNTGIGHILVVPYYTTQGTNATLFNIVNTDTTNGKLVKVRVRGASNSDDLFDFQLFLSPGDVWAAKLSQDANGVSQLQTSDATCTLPSTVRTQANSFNVGATSRLNPALSAAAKANETREGYIEILNMADIPKNSTADQNTATTGQTLNPLFTAIKHVSGVAPCTPAAFNPLLTDAAAYSTAGAGNTATASTTLTGKGLVFPTGQLFANYTIIDTVRTATFGGTATAVRATAGGVNATANAVFFPQLTNTVASASVNGYTSDPLFRTDSLRIASGATTVGAGTTAIIAATQQDFPDLSTPYTVTSATAAGPVFADGANAPDARLQASNLSASLQAKSVVNEFLTTTSISATTDWVFSMPTRRYNVAMNYAYTNPLGGNGRVYSDYNATVGAGTVGGTNFFTSANTSVNSAGQICVASASLTPFDREENTSSLGFTISPGAATTVSFCGEVSVLAVNNGTASTSGSLAASVALSNLNLSTSVGTANEGWMTISTTGLDSTTAGSTAWPNAVWASPAAAANANGLPVVGAAFAKSTSFGALWNHRYSR